MSFERIVRPFQTRDVTPSQRIFDPSEVAQENVTLKCGEVGSTTTFSGNYSGSVSSYCPSRQREMSRTVETKRIENPDDSTQYVNVEMAKSIKFNENNGAQREIFLHNKPA